jgi:hypothetical protein
MNSYENHYSQYLDVYRELSVANEGKTVWIPTDDHDGWYVNSSVQDEDSEAWERGYPRQSRPSILPDDLSADVDRTAYTTISYAHDDAYNTAYYRQDGDSVEWMDNFSDRLPDYGDLTAWALFVDIDIDKDYKQRPLSDDHRDIISQRLNLWTKAFSEMANGMDHVQILDSGGGMYVFIPPTALSPIADKYDKEDLNIIFNHIGKRMRTIVGKLNELICAQDDAPKQLFAADKVQNKNRQFKTVGAIHKDLDAVVYPISPDNIKIEHKTMEDISDDEIQKAMKWAEKFTSDNHRKCVDSVIEYMFQGDFTQRDDMELDYIDGEGWEEIIDNWLEKKKESIRAWEISKEEREDISEQKLKTDITQDKDVARESVRRVNNQKLKQYIVEYLGEDLVYEKNNEEMDFFPFWRGNSTESGRSAFYDFYEGKARFTDKSDGTSRNIVYWVALEMNYDEDEPDIISSPSEDLSPSDYSKCIDELRDRGEDIPILVPNIEEDEELEDWRIREIALKLGIASEDDLVKTDEGYLNLTPEDWNRTLDRLDHEQITHNKKKRRPLKKIDINPYVSSEIQEKASKKRIYNMFFNKNGHYEKQFESKQHYTDFIESLPEYVIPFKYEGEINGSVPDGVVAGVLADQTEDTVHMTLYEPFPIESIDAIDTYTDLKIEVNQNLDKSDMSVFVKQDEFEFI